MSELGHVFSPITIGRTEVANRVFMPAHTVLYAEDHHLSERHIAYYRERARGGTGLIITEGGAVHPSQRGAFHDAFIAYDRADIPRFAELAQTLHELGTKVFMQLFAIGVHMRGTHVLDDWTPLWGPSRVPSVRDREIPLALEREHIDALLAGFADSAQNLVDAGLDGVELHAAHSYLLGQFLSPAYNKRTDAYGGTVANRARLALEAAQVVRDRVGDALTLGIRLSFDEWLGSGGITATDSEETLELFAASGLFDYFNISGGGYHTMHEAVAPMNVPEGHMVPFAQRAKAVVGDRAKIMIVGRIIDLPGAERILADGAADMIGMTRAHMADPFLMEKGREGRLAETVRCVGANECFNSGGRQITCMMNPAMGRERRWGRGTLSPVSDGERRRVLVIGGGPAGMRSAAVAAARGHEVTLVDSGSELGGHLNLIKQMPTRAGWQRAIDNLVGALDHEDVGVRLGERASRETVDEASAEVVVVAAGSTWDSTGFSPFRPDRETVPGHEQAHVIGLDEACRRAVTNPASLGGHVVILDESGAYLPVGLAELLADAGCEVAIVTPHMFVGDQLGATMDLPHVYPRLHAKGVRLVPQSHLDRIEADTVSVTCMWSGEVAEHRADSVVMATSRIPHDELYHQLADHPVARHRVGDALAPRTAALAIYEGESLGRSL